MAENDLDLDRPEPIYVQLAAILRAQMEHGELTGRIPSAVQLGRQYGCSRDSALHAIGVLAAEGLVVTVHGRGTFTTNR